MQRWKSLGSEVPLWGSFCHSCLPKQINQPTFVLFYSALAQHVALAQIVLISWSDKSYYQRWRSINAQLLLLPSTEKETDNNSQQNDSHCYRHNNYRNLALVAGCSYCWDEKQKMEIKVKMIVSLHTRVFHARPPLRFVLPIHLFF